MAKYWPSGLRFFAKPPPLCGGKYDQRPSFSSMWTDFNSPKCINDRVSGKRADALLAVGYENFARLLHTLDGVFGSLVLLSHEGFSVDLASIVVCECLLQRYRARKTSDNLLSISIRSLSPSRPRQTPTMLAAGSRVAHANLTHLQLE